MRLGFHATILVLTVLNVLFVALTVHLPRSWEQVGLLEIERILLVVLAVVAVGAILHELTVSEINRRKRILILSADFVGLTLLCIAVAILKGA